jgi:hypothetical protein
MATAMESATSRRKRRGGRARKSSAGYAQAVLFRSVPTCAQERIGGNIFVHALLVRESVMFVVLIGPQVGVKPATMATSYAVVTVLVGTV